MASSNWNASHIAALVVALVAASGYAWLAAGTLPFTAAADAWSAVPFLLVAALAWRAGRRSAGRDAVTLGVGSVTRLRAWVVAIALFVALELGTLFAEPRRRFPTASALLDSFDHSRPNKALVFLLWLLLGWALVGR